MLHFLLLGVRICRPKESMGKNIQPTQKGKGPKDIPV